ncbi:MAG: alpha/beta hydrolase family protein [Acidimicrobiales bacterium]
MTRYRPPAALALRALLMMIVSLALASCSPTTAARHSTRTAQQLERFYATEPTTRLPLGALLRVAPLTTMGGSPVTVPDAMTYRVLYVSRSADGHPTTSSAMLFVPTSVAPKGGRPVVAWAHPTRSPRNVAPSRSSEPLLGMQPWLDEMVSRGWAVVATDYAGLGTPGHQSWLDGRAEANDVVGSVLAARRDPSVKAGTKWLAWGHSYGGHAVLWTAALASQLAPSLRLVGVAAAAPVAELVQLEGATGQAWAPSVEKQVPPPQTNVPVLIVQGTNDTVVPASTTATLRKAWCAQGVALTVEWIKGATHESVVKATSGNVVAWLARRLAGEGPRSNC